MTYKFPTSQDIAKNLAVKTLKEYADLLRKPKLTNADIKNLRRLREAARIAKSLGI